MDDATPKKRLRPTTLVVVLKDLKKPWEIWCHAHGLTPSEGVRRVLHRVLEGAQGSEPQPSVASISTEANEEWRRVEIRLNAAEHLAVTDLADREGMSIPRWLTGLVRLHLTGEPQFGEAEVQVLTRSSQVLLALGRNVNEIARNMKRGTHPDPLTLAQIDYLTELVKKHTQAVSGVLSANSRRWRR